MQRRRRAAAQSATIRAESGSTARTLWIAAPTRARGPALERVDALDPGVGVAVGEALLHLVGLLPMPPCR